MGIRTGLGREEVAILNRVVLGSPVEEVTFEFNHSLPYLHFFFSLPLLLLFLNPCSSSIPLDSMTG